MEKISSRWMRVLSEITVSEMPFAQNCCMWGGLHEIVIPRRMLKFSTLKIAFPLILHNHEDDFSMRKALLHIQIFLQHTLISHYRDNLIFPPLWCWHVKFFCNTVTAQCLGIAKISCSWEVVNDLIALFKLQF